MSYIFLNRYCEVTANLPETGIISITGWIIRADENSISIVDENNTHYPIQRHQLVGSIVVMLEQKPEPEWEMEVGREVCVAN
ncbi:MAG TPA: hypothetical protein VK808_07045 [Bacteroidia bacterium]|nr:hypothetical protein [Bacteroidia bacterium]